MNVNEFNSLELSRKSDIVWEWGYYISTRREGTYTVALFLTGTFWTEVFIAENGKTEMINGLLTDELKPHVIESLNEQEPIIAAALKLKPETSKRTTA